MARNSTPTSGSTGARNLQQTPTTTPRDSGTGGGRSFVDVLNGSAPEPPKSGAAERGSDAVRSRDELREAQDPRPDERRIGTDARRGAATQARPHENSRPQPKIRDDASARDTDTSTADRTPVDAASPGPTQVGSAEPAAAQDAARIAATGDSAADARPADAPSTEPVATQSASPETAAAETAPTDTAASTDVPADQPTLALDATAFESVAQTPKLPGNSVSSAAHGTDAAGTTGKGPPHDVLEAVRALLAARMKNSAADPAAAAGAAAGAATPDASTTAGATALATGEVAVDLALLASGGAAPGESGPARPASDHDDETPADGAMSLLAAMLQSAPRDVRPTASATQPAEDATATPLSQAGAGPAGGGIAGLAQRAIEASLQLMTQSQPAESSTAGKADAQSAAVGTDPATATLTNSTPTAAVFDLRAAPALRHAAGPTLPVHSPVGTQQWADEVGASVRWMTDGGIQSASLRLNPENLGPVEVRLTVQDGQTNVYFTAPHAETRAALEQALPRLREMLASQGLSLGDAGVSRQSSREPGRQPGPGLSRVESLTRDEPIVNPVTSRGLGLVDLYA